MLLATLRLYQTSFDFQASDHHRSRARKSRVGKDHTCVLLSSLHVQGFDEHKPLQVAVRRAIADGGFVRDDASDELSKARAKIRTIQNRLNNLLKGMNGEMSEQVIRQLCPVS